MYRDSIRAIYEHLSPGYRRIADFLVDHYQDAAFMTAAEVARSASVDTALVVRFAQRLGYPGYPELITEIQEDVKRDLRAVYEPPAGDDSPGQVIRRNLMQDRNNLEYVQLHLDLELLDRIVEILTKANRIFVGGEGTTRFLGEAMADRLLALGFATYILPCELAAQAGLSARIRRGDALVGFGITSMTPGVAIVMKLAREAGAETIGIVGSLANPVAAVAEHVLLVPVTTVGLSPSWTALTAIAHGITQGMVVRQSEATAEWVLRADRYLRSYADLLGRLPPISQTIKSYTAEK